MQLLTQYKSVLPVPSLSGNVTQALCLAAILVANDCEVLRELIPVLGLQVPLHIHHELLQARCQMRLPVNWLLQYDLLLQLLVDLLIYEDEAQHGPAQAPLVATLLKQDDLKKGLQDLGQQLGLST